MSKYYRDIKKGGRPRKGAPFVRVLHSLYDSPAWQSLKPVERALYLELVRRYTGYNNGEIFLSCREAAVAIHVSKASAGRAYQVLQERGLIALVTPSGFNLKQARATRYRLTCEFSFDEKGLAVPATNEWRTWGTR